MNGEKQFLITSYPPSKGYLILVSERTSHDIDLDKRKKPSTMLVASQKELFEKIEKFFGEDK